MADISMCADMHCPSKTICYRFTAPVTPNYQAYGGMQRDEDAVNCDMFWPNGLGSQKCKKGGAKREGEGCNLGSCSYPNCIKNE